MKNQSIAAIAVSTALLSVAPARAQEDPPREATAVPAGTASTDATDSAIGMPVVSVANRGRVLPALYASFGALQTYDAYATVVGIRHGAVEMNPIARGLADHPAALVGVKAALTATSIGAADYLWRRHHRRTAVCVMLISNGIAAVVGAHNTAVLRGQR